jgi:hypothetical protein
MSRKRKTKYGALLATLKTPPPLISIVGYTVQVSANGCPHGCPHGACTDGLQTGVDPRVQLIFVGEEGRAKRLTGHVSILYDGFAVRHRFLCRTRHKSVLLNSRPTEPLLSTPPLSPGRVRRRSRHQPPNPPATVCPSVMKPPDKTDATPALRTGLRDEPRARHSNVAAEVSPESPARPRARAKLLRRCACLRAHNAD